MGSKLDGDRPPSSAATAASTGPQTPVNAIGLGRAGECFSRQRDRQRDREGALVSLSVCLSVCLSARRSVVDDCCLPLIHLILLGDTDRPYETSRVITGLSNLLNNYPVGSGLDGPTTKGEKAMTKEHYMQVLRQYAVAHTRSHPANSSLPYIGESIEPDLGFWQARAIMYGQEPSARGYQPPKPDRDRSVDYNHSTFADLIIEGLIGLRAALGSLFTINPLATGLSYFAIDNVAYHNHSLTVAWDEDGVRNYTGCKQGLCVWADGKLIGTSPVLKKLQLSLPNADLDV
jgi:hypothetical protein